MSKACIRERANQFQSSYDTKQAQPIRFLRENSSSEAENCLASANNAKFMVHGIASRSGSSPPDSSRRKVHRRWLFPPCEEL